MIKGSMIYTESMFTSLVNKIRELKTVDVSWDISWTTGIYGEPVVKVVWDQTGLDKYYEENEDA